MVDVNKSVSRGSNIVAHLLARQVEKGRVVGSDGLESLRERERGKEKQDTVLLFVQRRWAK